MNLLQGGQRDSFLFKYNSFSFFSNTLINVTSLFKRHFYTHCVLKEMRVQTELYRHKNDNIKKKCLKPSSKRD